MDQIAHSHVWAILAKECGARPEMPDDFPRQWPKCVEYRFIGALGFGGKIWATREGWYVTNYPENDTPERNEMRARANKALNTAFQMLRSQQEC